MSLKTIAKKVGVSVSTVSRALNDPSYKCSTDEIREKIWEEARKEHYLPNTAARNLKLKQVDNTGILYINILITRTDGSQADPFFAELFRSLQGELHKSNCILQNVWHMAEFSDERKCIGMNIQRTVDRMYQKAGDKNDGLFIIGKCAAPVLEILKKRNENIVSINRNSTNYMVDEVLCDGRTIARAATEYLIDLGHSEIGYIGACHHESRYKGFTDALAGRNLDIVPQYIIETHQTEREGYDAMQMLMEAESIPTALFCANDITAIGALKYLNSSHIRKKKRPAIISCDDIEEARFFRPSLTTFHLDKDEMAKHAMYLLSDRVRGGHKSIARIEVQSHLVVRESCING